MSAVMDAVLDGKPWSVSATLFALDDVLDTEGRPVSERRAPSATKRDVPIELKACPYHDERQGMPMNVSALAQITRYLPEVSARLADFRAATGLPRTMEPCLRR